ncbi:hypothetical protein LZ554_002323 [Drepanopeziza brunnea f. sp. 'monogermtubi']|nr:hypothetical protein LZ554_002323 [Drepanopeziza brunnea f. sp. 'monogermtubi']
MRYQNWDVLLFPDEYKVPLQEFKTSCQVIQDPEAQNLQPNPFLLPTVTSFVPGIAAGAAFRVSIHCWQNPEISRYVQSLKKTGDTIMFEARLFIDGRLAGSKWFHQTGPWPTIIELSMDLDKHGEFEKLKFPTFHKELLSRTYWNPGDDLGRVKVIIAEGFSREHMAYPFERIKNVVAFSFQHAPLDVLEASSIAWPNAGMWRQVSLMGPYFGQQFSPRQGSDVEAHSHSPRHGQPLNFKSAFSATTMGSMPPPPLLPRQSTFDPFVEAGNPAFTGWRQSSKSDTSMPDYTSSNTRTASSRQVSDPMQYEKTNGRYESIQMPGAFESLCEALLPSAPVNTPDMGTRQPSSTVVPKTAGPNIKSRKENILDSPFPLVVADLNPVGNENATRKVSLPFVTDSPIQSIVEPIRKPSYQFPSKVNTVSTSPATTASNSASLENPMRRVSQPFATTNSGTKRQRVVTPAASKVIDDEDEPARSSPSRAASLSMRKASQASIRATDNKENGRVILGGIENV